MPKTDQKIRKQHRVLSVQHRILPATAATGRFHPFALGVRVLLLGGAAQRIPSYPRTK